MERLRQRDYRAVLDALEECFGVPDGGAFGAAAARAVRRLVAADRASYNVVGRTFSAVLDPPAGGLAGAGRTLGWYTAHYIQMQAEHPLLIHWRRTGHGGAVRMSDFVTARQYHRLALYNEALKHLGTEHMLRISWRLSPDAVAGITLGRGRRDFSDRDTLVLNLLRPLLARAERQVRLVGRLRRQVALAAGAVDPAAPGIVLLTAANRVASVDARAYELLEGYFGARAVAGELPDDLLRWIGHMERTAGRLDDGPSPRTPLVVKRGHRFLVASLVVGHDRRLLVLEERVTALAPETRGSVRLTPRETDVLMLAAQGRSNREIAADLGTSVRTVDKHFEHVYDRLGVRPRNAALTQALRSLAAARPRQG
jgi:DNA-binding CsgD family transcriptional regulator